MGLFTEEVSLIVTRLVCPAQLRYNIPDTGMTKCSQCGGRLRRVHRTFFERFRYAAIYYCKSCETEECVPRLFQYRFGPYCRCPRCGTYRLTKLKERDRIDKMQTGFLNLMERMSGGKLMHCRYCRIQFYDRRPRVSEGVEENGEQTAASAQPQQARGDA